MLVKNYLTLCISLGKVAGIFSLPIVIFISCVYLGVWGKIPKTPVIISHAQYEPSQVFDVEGRLITEFQKYNRKPVSLSEIPPHIIDALIATEDIRFYDHKGVDTKSLFRVFFKTLLLNDKASGGGSTLSQQIAKNIYKREDHSWLSLPVAKVKEMIIAHRLESAYNKQEILALYLNIIPFSGNTYGIESASKKFFNKPASQLTLAEGALLIGTLKATHFYDPQLYTERSKNRRDVVLHQMYKYDFLDSQSYQCHKEESIHLEAEKQKKTTEIASHFKQKLEQTVLAWCRKNSGNGRQIDLYSSGLKIHTTLDIKMQQLAEQSAQEHMAILQKQFEKEYAWRAPWDNTSSIFQSYVKQLPNYIKFKNLGYSHKAILDSLSLDQEESTTKTTPQKKMATLDSLRNAIKLLNMGMIGVEPTTGAIKIWIGGIRYDTSQYDHLSSKRQVGSTFKPIVYAAALDRGIDPCDYISGKEVYYDNLNNWSPSNAGQRRHDTLSYSMTGALSKSLNAVSVKVLERAGIKRVVSLSRKLNITSDLPKVPSLALGTSELSIPEIASAYTAFVNKGHPVEPYFLSHIDNTDGHTMQTFRSFKKNKRALKLDTQEMMLEMLQTVTKTGTASRLRYTYHLKNDIGGKTGTTQSNKDAWFVGVMPKLVTVTWVGHDDHRIGFRSTRTGQGANAALPVTALLLQKMNKDTTFNAITQARFPTPSDRVINKLDCPLSIDDYDDYNYFFPENVDSIERRSFRYRTY